MSHPIKRAALVALTAVVALPLFTSAADAKPKKKPSIPISVQTRNIFLGADLGPALNATGFESFIEANGGILREVTLTDFPRRAKGLAAEFAENEPDLVGLQEAAMWRTGPVGLPPSVTGEPFTATTVRYDFVQNLLTELQAVGLNYEIAAETTEFDFEAPADENNVDDDAPAGIFNPDPGVNDEGASSLDDAELNGRLTMRDVILVNKDSKVKPKISNPLTGNFTNVFTPTVSGLPIEVTRGWGSVDVQVQKKYKVKKANGKKKNKTLKRKFHFVNSHFEAFDDETEVPSIRAKQAAELLAGPASDPRSIIVGDFNSDVPGVKPGDDQAFQTLLNGGFTNFVDQPGSCCINDLFAPTNTFDHQVDHVMTNLAKKKVQILSSKVTGMAPSNGIYNSDHAGVFAKLKLR